MATEYDALPYDITSVLTQEYPLPGLNEHTRKEVGNLELGKDE